MSVQRFFGASNREAMAKVRAALGDGALILANRPGDEGVEILALAEQDVDRLADAPPPGQHSDRLLQEVARVRALLGARQGPGADPQRARLWQQLRRAGFSAALGESLLDALPGQPPEDWLARQLQARLRVAAPRAGTQTTGQPPEIVALIGPTGVGKTTTAAKLMAHHVRAHGAAGVALVSADNQRPGAHFQLGFHADRLGVRLMRLDDDRQLGDLPDVHDPRLVIIDTAGLGQRDPRLAAQLRQLGGGPPVTPVLLLSAASHPRTLDEVVVHYRATAEAAGLRLEQAIITKLDEAVRIGPVLDVLMRHQLRLQGVCDGQRVPEDLRAAAAAELVAAALAGDGTDDEPGAAAERVPSPRRLVHQSRVLGEVLALLRRHSADGGRLEALWCHCAAAGAGRPVAAAAHHPGEAQAVALSWYGGADRAWRAQPLDGAGQPLAGACREWAVVGMAAALGEAESCWSAGVHMLPRLPDAAAWHWLTDRRALWVSRARANNRVWQGGERRSLAECRGRARPAGGVSLPYRGRAVRAVLHCLPVAAPLQGGGVSAVLEAWFADLRDRVTGAPLAQRCWLLPAGLDGDIAMALAVDQLRNEDLPVLAGHALARLPAAMLQGQAPTEGEGRGDAALALAHGLAALACRLDGEDAEWALDLRARLLNLDGRRRRRGPRALLEALITLFSTLDAVREMAPALALPATPD